MSPSATTQIATENDLEKLLELYTHLSPEEPPCALTTARASFDTFLRYPGSAIVLGKIDDMLVSSCAVIIIPNLTRAGTPYALIENVVTHAGFRRRGLARKVLEAATQRAWDHGCYKVMLLAGAQSSGVLSFYESCGFEQSKTGFQKRRIPARPG
ncbi:GNAT family N-acetyltransferase [Roseovarius sp. 2305UL8-3]|uniref:GNAT family N-acetyltransferase n=1 Tax=Roseovarius conchicola TaxID=3121636 RepID=UPI003529974B